MKILILCLLSLMLLFSYLGRIALIDPDEPRYAEGAREMMVLKDYLIPHLNFVPRLNKPVFFYWLILACYKIFGIGEFAARFPSAVLGLILIIGVYFWARDEIGEREALFSSLILLSTPIFFVLSRIAIIDVVFTTLILFALFSLWRSLRDKRNLGLFALFLGLSLATKGPAGLIIILFTILIFSILQKDFAIIKRFFHPLVISAVIIIGGSWYFLIWNKIGWVEFRSLVLQETLGRFHEGLIHKEPWYYYLPVVLGGFLPWSLFLLNFKKIDFKNEFLRFLIIFVLVVFSFFTVCKTKLLTYVLPLFPALAILCSDVVTKIWNQKQRKCLVLFLILLFSALLLLLLPPQVLKPLTAVSIKKIAFSLALFSLPLLYLSKYKLKTQFWYLWSLPFLIYFFLLFNYGDDFSGYRSCKGLFKDQNISQGEIYTWNLFEPSIVFYAQRKVKELTNLDDFNGGYLVIKKEDAYLFSKHKLSAHSISETDKYYLLQVFP